MSEVENGRCVVAQGAQYPDEGWCAQFAPERACGKPGAHWCVPSQASEQCAFYACTEHVPDRPDVLVTRVEPPPWKR